MITPMLDIRSIGAGGGSIAWIDDGGSLRVGPKSAGADPGPACYGRGGKQPTVTDANLVLGRIDPALGGKLDLDVDAATEAIRTVAEPLGLSVLDCAEGITQIVSENMATAIRMVSTDRGRDPRDHTLVAFGGAGGLHAYEIARAVGHRPRARPAVRGRGVRVRGDDDGRPPRPRAHLLRAAGRDRPWARSTTRSARWRRRFRALLAADDVSTRRRRPRADRADALRRAVLRGRDAGAGGHAGRRGGGGARATPSTPSTSASTASPRPTSRSRS